MTSLVIRARYVLQGVALLVALICCGDLPAKEVDPRQGDLRELLKQTFPTAYAEVQRHYGIHQVADGDRCQRPVVLIHGLDDPGTIWRDIVPQLEKKGYCTYQFNYPNDQPIRDSARFLFAELQRHHVTLGDEVFLIAHSMGGLVSREMLTSPSVGYTKNAAEGSVPKVNHLIMVGTPNHGSVFAKMRILLEIVDHAVNAFDGDYNLLRMFFDGMGEAGEDLYPKSEFLTTLNGRVPPKVRMTVIAGTSSPWPPQLMAAFLDQVRMIIPEGLDLGFRAYEPELRAAVLEVGDGLVSVSSASLPSVPLVKVPANHVTMIRKLVMDGNDIPPAIPVILDILAAGEK